MPSKTRGRERLLNCDSCGRRIPRDKAVSYNQMVVYSTDLKSNDDVRTSLRREFHYCPSCGKHRHIYQRLGRDAARRAERFGAEGQNRFRREGGSGGHVFNQAKGDSWAAYQPGGSKSGHNSPRKEEIQEEEQSSSSETSESQSE